MSALLRVLMPDGITLRGVGLPDYAPGASFFKLGETMPTEENTGIPAGTVMTDYGSDIVTPRTVYIDTPGTVIENKNMGNIRLVIRASGVRLLRLRWWVTVNRTNVPMVSTNSNSVFVCYAEQCEIINYDQHGYLFNGFEGHDIWLYRCKVMGTTDAFRPNLGPNCKAEGCFFGYLGWWGNDGVPYINKGNQSHADGVQTQWGENLVLRGNSFVGYPATWVGTGTPGSGTDTGNTAGWYTQAQAEARRAEVFTAMTDPAKSFDGLAHESGGTITPIMLTRGSGQGSTALNVLAEDNWIAGGVVQVNALDATLTSPVGTFRRNKHFNDAFYKVAGKSIGYRFAAGLTATVPQSGPDMNVYMDSGLPVPIVY